MVSDFVWDCVFWCWFLWFGRFLQFSLVLLVSLVLDFVWDFGVLGFGFVGLVGFLWVFGNLGVGHRYLFVKPAKRRRRPKP